MSAALIQRDDARMVVAFTPEAIELKNAALAASGLIGKVTTAQDNENAVAAQIALKEVLDQAEKARVACKAPVLEYGRKIDGAAKSFVEDLNAEMLRLSRMAGDYQTLQQAKERAAEKARNEELSRLERERAEAEAKATSHEALDAIQEHFNNKAAELGTAPTPSRLPGQVVRQDFEIEVLDVWLLARAHPTCVKIEPRLSEIKELLRQGVKVAGIKATPITTATVRANTRLPATIEV